MLKIGDLSLDVGFYQAPLSGYSDYAMRRLALDFGAPLTFSGVMLAKSAANPRVLRKEMFRPADDEHPIGAQILGADAEMMVKAAKDLLGAGYDVIDLNFACPAPKVLRRGRGGALLKEPEKAIEIFQRVREAVSCPLMIKLRGGYKGSSESRDNFFKIASCCTDEGVDAISVHGRSVTGRYKGQADWGIIAEVKRQHPATTIIGSGDIFEAGESFEKMKQAGVDGVLVARGAIGNPWIFRNLRAAFEGKDQPEPPGLAEQRDTILKHFELVSRIYRPGKAVRYFRKFMANYCRLHPERKNALATMMAARTEKQFVAGIDQWYGG